VRAANSGMFGFARSSYARVRRILFSLDKRLTWMSAILVSLLGSFRSRAALQFEIVALRHQINVLRRSAKRPKLTDADRVFWAWLSGVWSNWRTALVIVRPETVIAWHRRGFRWFWTWKVRHGKRGRPKVPEEVRELIRRLSRENHSGARHASMANYSNSALR
jgi:hypothetical protein